MKINVIGFTQDFKTNTHVIYAKVLVEDYLLLVGNDFSEFYIQRKKESHKAYKRLKDDILKGTLLPSITLAVKPDYVEKINKLIEENNTHEVERALEKDNIVNILDGLQRTYILKELKDSGANFKEGQSVLLEFWLEENIKHLIYRLIVLNSGQKPMSMRHQVELLFLTIKENLESEIEGLDIYLERDASRRDRAGKFPLERVVSGYQSFITKSTELKKDNIVAKRLAESEILDSNENELNDNFSLFKIYLEKYVELDSLAFALYSNTKANWFADENVMSSFFAALSDFGSISEGRKERIDVALEKLLSVMRDSQEGIGDPLGLEKFTDIKAALDPKKDNVGYATRKLLMSGFKEFFREEGDKTLEACWISEAK